MKNESPFPKRKHLPRLKQIFDTSRSPIFYVTICSYERKSILTHPEIANEIMNTFNRSEELHGWHVGRYVIMPDHVHFFCWPDDDRKDLAGFIRDFKKYTARAAAEKGITSRVWQKEFFDHLIRSSESFEGKWEYVRNNPVRAGLCESPEEWKFQGEICELFL